MSTKMGTVGISIGLDGEFLCDAHYIAYRNHAEKREAEIALGRALIAGVPLEPRPKWYVFIGNHGGGGPCRAANPCQPSPPFGCNPEAVSRSDQGAHPEVAPGELRRQLEEKVLPMVNEAILDIVGAFEANRE